MYKELLCEDIAEIDKLPEEKQQFLYGLCDKWVIDNYIPSLEIVAIMLEDHGYGIVHSYLRHVGTGICFDIRGEFKNDEDILRYTGIRYGYNSIEEYVFENLNDFKKYLQWVDFERIKEQFMS